MLREKNLVSQPHNSNFSHHFPRLKEDFTKFSSQSDESHTNDVMVNLWSIWGMVKMECKGRGGGE